MESNYSRLGYLLNRYSSNEATVQELEEMFRLIAENDPEQELELLVEELRKKQETEPDEYPADWEKMWTGVLTSVKNTKKPVRVIKWWFAAAAAIFLLASLILLFNPGDQSVKQTIVENRTSDSLINDRLPGTNKAILTLSDGREIILNNQDSGMIARDGKSVVINNKGAISYKSVENSTDVSLMNTVNTPRGGQYMLLLPDGTRVWLNAESSIHYPVLFGNKNRMVTVRGEAYFEVNPEKARPFIVALHAGNEIEVLGTAFNVNSYTADQNVVTLLEGSIQCKTKNTEAVLFPGQQAWLSEEQPLNIISNAPVEDVIAWKNGFFRFSSVDIRTMMEQAMRWYDVTVEYPEGVPEDLFSGTIPRSVNLSQFLKILKYSDIEVSITGDKVIIR